MNIKELAEQAGLGTTSNDVWYPLPIGLIHLERFAELVAAAEREKCAKLCDLVAREIDDTNGLATYIAKGIRARGDTK